MQSSRNKKPKKFSERTQGIFCLVLGIFSCLSFKQMWLFAILLFLCAGFNFWHYNKTKENCEAMKKIERRIKEEWDDDFDDDDEDLDIPQPQMSVLSKKERKERYKAFLNDLDEKLGDFEIDEDEEDY